MSAGTAAVVLVTLAAGALFAGAPEVAAFLALAGIVVALSANNDRADARRRNRNR